MHQRRCQSAEIIAQQPALAQSQDAGKGLLIQGVINVPQASSKQGQPKQSSKFGHCLAIAYHREVAQCTIL